MYILTCGYMLPECFLFIYRMPCNEPRYRSIGAFILSYRFSFWPADADMHLLLIFHCGGLRFLKQKNP